MEDEEIEELRNDSYRCSWEVEPVFWFQVFCWGGEESSGSVWPSWLSNKFSECALRCCSRSVDEVDEGAIQ